jgi:alkylation response protein AidB-like acyl-CoA dehydrogenase
VVLARRETAEVETSLPTNTRCPGDRVEGTKLFVPFGAHADALLVETRDGLVLVPRPGTGWRATPMPTLDHAQRFAEIELANDAATRVADPERAAQILADVDRLAALGGAAQLLGVMERCLEMTLDYTKERQAFGVPIASFQALQHRCADMLARTEGARSATYRAAWATDHEPEAAAYLTAVAKAWSGPAARHVCGETIQMHGGVGFTWEYDPHIFLKRAHTLEAFYGGTRSQLDAVLDARRL